MVDTGFNNLQSILDSQDRTQAWLARRMKVSRSLVHLVIRGKRPATPRFKRLASQALGLPIPVIFPVSVDMRMRTTNHDITTYETPRDDVSPEGVRHAIPA